MDIGILPEEGAAQVGPVPPPAGQRVRAGSGAPVAWVTSEPVADAGPMWRALSDVRPVTGLVPVMLTPPSRRGGHVNPA
jgi:hypothetical protein